MPRARVVAIDFSSAMVEDARRRYPALDVRAGDAQALTDADASYDAVVMSFGLLHLEQPDVALREAHRVLALSGTVVAAAISRYASALDGLSRKVLDPAFLRIRDQDLVDGQHRNPTNKLDYFTTAYFHRPGDLRDELEEAGFSDVDVMGVEGVAWMFADFESRWADEALRQDILNIARALEAEPSIVGASAHLLAIGRKL